MFSVLIDKLGLKFVMLLFVFAFLSLFYITLFSFFFSTEGYLENI
jgi:hypothetical protein